MIQKTKNRIYTQFSPNAGMPRRGWFLRNRKKITALVSIFVLVFAMNYYIIPTQDAQAAPINDMTAVIPEGSDAVDTDGTITITFPTNVLIDAEEFTFYIGEPTGGAEWVLNSVTTGDIACTDDGTAADYTADSVAAASATEPMKFVFTATDITDGALTTCTIGDTTPDPTSPDTAGIYSVAMVTAADSGAASIYVGDTNDVTVSTTVLPNMTLLLDSASGGCSGSPVVTCDLGVVLQNSTVTGTYDVNGGTNAATDMTIQIAEDGDLGTINDVVNDETVAGDGTEEYGIEVSDGGAEWTPQGNYASNDTPIATGPVDFYTSTGPADIAGQDITVIHKAAIDSTTAPGVHSHVVTYTGLATF